MKFSRADIVWIALVALVFLASGFPFLTPRLPPDNAALLWMPNAVLAVAMLRRMDKPQFLSVLVAVAIMSGCIASVYSADGGDWSRVGGWAILLIGDCLEAFLIAFGLTRITGASFSFRGAMDVVLWAGLAIFASAIAFFVAPIADRMGLASPIETDPLAPAWANWVFGDVNAYMTLGAFLVAVTSDGAQKSLTTIRADAVRCGFIALALIVCGVIGFGGPALLTGTPTGATHPGYLGLILPALAWAAFRYGAIGAGVSLALTLTPGVILTLNGMGSFAPELHPNVVREMQILVFALSFATLLIGVLGDEARKGRDAAMAADQAKTRFLTRIGHELRTPLNGVIGAGDLLAREMDEADPKLLDRLDLIRSSARTLASVVEDLVEYAALHREGISLRQAPFPAEQPLRDAAAIFGPRARWNGVDLSLHLKGFENLNVKGDAARWRQVFFNLVSNAVESTQRGEISIEAQALKKPGGGVVIEAVVRDTGLGIPQERVQQIFEPFMQGEDAHGRPVPGLGLGLAVVKETLAALGGDVRVESAPGKGSAFFVTLPAEEIAAAPLATKQGKARALLADDNPTNRVVLSAQLAALGFDVVTVETGAEALAAAEKEDFSLILMDIQMPVMDGEEAIERIRLIEGHRGRTPIVVVTAHALPGDDIRFKAAGADSFLAKPVEHSALAEAVGRVLI